MCGCSPTECSVGGEEVPPAPSSTADVWIHSLAQELTAGVVAGCDNVMWTRAPSPTVLPRMQEGAVSMKVLLWLFVVH